MNIRFMALRGIKWTALSTIFISVFQLAQYSILSRILDPSDFGLMAVMMVVIGFSQAFMDMGISNAIIHVQDISHIQLSSLYWLNIFSGFFLTVIVFLISPIIAGFYEKTEMIQLLQLLSLVFIITSVGNQYRVLFQKELQFNRMAQIEIFASLGSFLLAVTLAKLGYGVLSLVYAVILQTSFSSLCYLVAGVKFSHSPKLVYSHSEVKRFLHFGLFQMGEKSINFFNSQFDVLLIGKLLGTELTGIYHIAKTLTMKVIAFTNPIVTRVTLPVMAKVQNDEVALKNAYLKMVNYLSFVSFPIYVSMIFLAEPIMHTLFGAQWSAGIPLLRVLSFYMLLRSVGNPVGTLLLAKGRADLGFYWNLGVFLIMPLTIYLGSFYGLIGVSGALVLLMLLLIAPSWYFLIQPLCNASFSEYLKTFTFPLILIIGASLPGYICLYFIENYLLQIAMFLSINGIAYLLLLRRYKPSLLKLLRDFSRK